MRKVLTAPDNFMYQEKFYNEKTMRRSKHSMSLYHAPRKQGRLLYFLLKRWKKPSTQKTFVLEESNQPKS